MTVSSCRTVGRLMALSSNMRTMSPLRVPHHLCDTKLESIGQRIARYQEVPTPYRVSTQGVSVVNVKCQPNLA